MSTINFKMDNYPKCSESALDLARAFITNIREGALLSDCQFTTMEDGLSYNVDLMNSKVESFQAGTKVSIELPLPSSNGCYVDSLEMVDVDIDVLTSVVGNAIQLTLLMAEHANGEQSEVRKALEGLMEASSHIVPLESKIKGSYYTVVLLYPDPIDAETYTNTVFATDAKDAVRQVIQMAITDNTEDFDEDEFLPLNVFRGICESVPLSECC